jgi:MarR family transcriptional regulator, temperature-dependent positive regulator of motility
MTTLAEAARQAERRVLRSSAGSAVGFRLSASPSHLLRRAEQFAAEIFMKAGGDGVTLRQTVLLAAIGEAEGASQSDLVRATGIDRSTLAEMMARMEKKGLIARQAARDDGRAKSVKLTAAGRGKLAETLPSVRRVDEALIRALPKDKRASFRATLTALAIAANVAHDTEVAEIKKQKKASKLARADQKVRKKRKRNKKRGKR